MCDIPKKQQKLTDKEVISFFVKYLAVQGNPGLKVDSWPDEENRQSTDIDATAGLFAIEHTSIDTIPNQRRDSAWFVQVVQTLEEEFRYKIEYRLELIFPYEGIQTGQDWTEITNSIRNWVLVEASKLSVGRHVIKKTNGIPFRFYATKSNSSQSGLLFLRFALDDQTFHDRLRKQLDRKIKKLKPYKGKGQNKTTILLIESDDIALMNDGIMWDGLRSTYPDGLANGLDQIWFADTSILEDIQFSNMSQAVM